MAINQNSETWETTKKWAEARIAELRTENDTPSLGERETQEIRGRIAALKDLLDLPKAEEPAPVVHTGNYI